MASCRYCGKTAGYSGVCKECTPKAEAERVEIETQQNLENLERATEELEDAMAQLLARLNSGLPVHLHLRQDVRVESFIDGKRNTRADFRIVTQLGLSGWELIQIVPKTDGIPLTNTSIGMGTESWAGAIGGNIVGGHAIFKKTYHAVPSDLEEFRRDVALALSGN